MECRRKALSFFICSMVASCLSFSYGPPATEHVCREMFPEGHHVDSQTKEAPYEIDLSQNTYTPWDILDGELLFAAFKA